MLRALNEAEWVLPWINGAALEILNEALSIIKQDSA